MNETQQFNDQSTDSLDSDFALEVWHRRKWVALVVFCAAFAAVVAATRALPDLYRASASVFVARQQVSEAFVKASVTTELETRIQTIQEQVMSRAGLTDVIARAGLYPEFEGNIPEGVIQGMRQDIELNLTSVAQSYGRSTIAFTLAYSGHDPQTVARVANTLAAIYVEQNTKSREGQAARTAGFLKTQLDDVKRDLDGQLQRSNDFKLHHSGELPDQVVANVASLERLYTKLRTNGESQNQVLQRRERLEEQLTGVDSGQDVAGTALPVREQLSKLRLELAELRKQYTEAYPDVIRAKAHIAALEQQVALQPPGERPSTPEETDATARLRRALNQVDAQLKPLKEEEAFLRPTIAGYESRIENAPQLQQELQRILSDYDVTKDRYESLLKRYEEAELADTLEQGQSGEQFRILDPALPPSAPAAPNRPRLLILGLLASLALAFGAVVAAEKFDTSFHNADELRAFVNVPTLAAIRLIPTQTAGQRRRRLLPVMVVALLIGLALIAAGSRYVASGNEQLLRLAARVG